MKFSLSLAKVILIALGASLLIAFISLIVFVGAYESQMKMILTREAEAKSRIAAQLFKRSLEVGDYALTSATSADLMSDNTVSKIIVKNRFEDIIVNASKSSDPSTSVGLDYVGTQVVILGGEADDKIGAVDISYDFSSAIEIFKIARSRMLLIGGLLFFSVFVLFAVLVYFMQTIFARVDMALNKLILEDQHVLSAQSWISEINRLTQLFLVAAEKIRASKEFQFKKSKLESSATIAAQVAHDIRAPLTALQMLASRDIGLDGEMSVLFRNATQRIIAIADDLVKKSKQEYRMLNLSTFNVTSSIDTILREKRLVYRKEISIVSNVENAELQVFGDRYEFERILSNILNNANEAIERHGNITVATEIRDDWVMLRVSDTGRGIPDEVVAKAGRSRISIGKDSSSNSGTGSGLYHAINTIQSWSGEVSIRRLENGTEILIRLPRKK